MLILRVLAEVRKRRRTKKQYGFVGAVLLSKAASFFRGDMNFWKAMGKVPSRRERHAFQGLDYFDGRHFDNLHSRPVRISKKAILRTGRKLLFRRVATSPVRVPVVKTDLKALTSEGVAVVWLGHSSIFLKTIQRTILVDPVLSDYAAPFPGAVPAFPGTNLYTQEDFPKIDILLVTHDHYDHLDASTVVALKDKVCKVVVPLGIGSHLRYWGYPDEKIVELGWYDSYRGMEGMLITATPALHMSGRSPLLKRTLWASYVVTVAASNLYFGGDSGYGEHFQDIGQRFGPFDLAFLENGQYNANWPQNHSFPEQTLQAVQDLKAKMLFPVHWGRFCLSDHAWNQPIQRLMRLKEGIKVTVPKIGEPYEVGSEPKLQEWWRDAASVDAI